MELTVFVVIQLAFDALLALLVAGYLLRRRAAPAAPACPPELVLLVRDLLATTEAVIDVLEQRPAAPLASGAVSVEDALQAGLRLVRDAAAATPARGDGLLPGERRLADNVAAARAAAGRVTIETR